MRIIANRKQAEIFIKYITKYPKISWGDDSLIDFGTKGRLKLSDTPDSETGYSFGGGWGVFEDSDEGFFSSNYFYFEHLGFVPISQWEEKLILTPKTIINEEKDYYKWLAGDRE